MTRARKLRLLGEAEGHNQAQSLLEKPGDVVVDRRGVERALVMACPDGCGDVLTINLDGRSGKAWRLDRRHGNLTVYPSVWRDSGCRAHFIVWRGQILWCDWREGPDPADQALTNRVLGHLLEHSGLFVHYEQVAEALDENPWDVAWACRVLASNGKAIQKDFVLYCAGAKQPGEGHFEWE
ncbi:MULTISPECIES: DUF6527 family protein [unclassified Mesorhizobium]|uniref:DUF6527 family protein n=1 Tax=unclassified Mesorhizobium TaxID=325217 RepID=UPI00109390A7|nr:MULTISPECIES: DUF6527 family protein [unclassified Mesorhizobium]TGT91272.1 hypothetical protein EN804_08135 [Mesorhizobium sp. M8A.F.Ca.ET.161.01.1.1]TGV43449.1 hypothetical protein EN785_05415 [Mesorhizobium sp. M8A.F.Ca.ET.142.01.1.1]